MEIIVSGMEILNLCQLDVTWKEDWWASETEKSWLREREAGGRTLAI
jgi:hypothetical protein